ncbi:discoidin domain-containing protein [Acinetobacter towneri]|uniref:discoidin domain-containing protein n=1 Tax=Acinetobacter towneri TaxID=202956 RepID=UPI0034D3AC30
MPGIVLECSQHGDFDSFDVIRSLTSMNGVSDSNLPLPIATGLLTMYYVDTTVVEGGTYYYKFRVWRDGAALVSDEVKVLAIPNYCRYLRLWITADNGQDNYTEFQEIEIASVVAGPDITTPASPAWDSSHYTIRDATKLVDNEIYSINNIWTCDGVSGFPKWVSFDLGTEVTVSEIRMLPTWNTQFGLFVDRAPKDFIVQGSFDNVNWFDIKQVIGLTNWQREVKKTVSLVD